MKKILNICTQAIHLGVSAIPYVVVLVIFVVAAIRTMSLSSQNEWSISTTTLVFLMYAIALGILFYLLLCATMVIINVFTVKGIKYVAPYIIKYVHSEYSKGTLPESTTQEVLSLLKDFWQEGLPMDVKRWIQEYMNLQELTAVSKMLEEERIRKRNATVLDYSRSFFCGRLEDYESLESSIRQFLISMDPELHYDKLNADNSYTKSDIRVFCSNIQLYCGISVETMAKFQGKVFANWFPKTSEDSLISNFSKTGSSKYLKVTDTVSLEDIIAEMKQKNSK